jgi:hypothetical protein
LSGGVSELISFSTLSARPPPDVLLHADDGHDREQHRLGDLRANVRFDVGPFRQRMRVASDTTWNGQSWDSHADWVFASVL